MAIDNWVVSQQRSIQGLKKWCAKVVLGEHDVLHKQARLVPVVRIRELNEWRAGDHYVWAKRSDPAGAWWFEQGTDTWRKLMYVGGLVAIRRMEGENRATVGKIFGVFEIEKIEFEIERMYLRTGACVGMVRGNM